MTPTASNSRATHRVATCGSAASRVRRRRLVLTHARRCGMLARRPAARGRHDEEETPSVAVRPPAPPGDIIAAVLLAIGTLPVAMMGVLAGEAPVTLPHRHDPGRATRSSSTPSWRRAAWTTRCSPTSTTCWSSSARTSSRRRASPRAGSQRGRPDLDVPHPARASRGRTARRSPPRTPGSSSSTSSTATTRPTPGPRRPMATTLDGDGGRRQPAVAVRLLSRPRRRLREHAHHERRGARRRDPGHHHLASRSSPSPRCSSRCCPSTSGRRSPSRTPAVEPLSVEQAMGTGPLPDASSSNPSRPSCSRPTTTTGLARPHIDELIYQFFDNDEAQVNALIDGRRRLPRQLPADARPDAEGAPASTTNIAPSSDFAELGFNSWAPTPERFEDEGCADCPKGPTTGLDGRSVADPAGRPRRRSPGLLDKQALVGMRSSRLRRPGRLGRVALPQCRRSATRRRPSRPGHLPGLHRRGGPGRRRGPPPSSASATRWPPSASRTPTATASSTSHTTRRPWRSTPRAPAPNWSPAAVRARRRRGGQAGRPS